MLTKFFDTLANMGVWIRLHDNRADPPPEDGREWGAPVEGFAMSLASPDSATVSVLIKNLDDFEKRAALPGWLRYFQIELSSPAGSPVPLKAYGKRILENILPENTIERVFPPGKSVSTEIPIGALYDLDLPGSYCLRVSCPVPASASGANLVSNELTCFNQGNAI